VLLIPDHFVSSSYLRISKVSTLFLCRYRNLPQSTSSSEWEVPVAFSSMPRYFQQCPPPRDSLSSFLVRLSVFPTSAFFGRSLTFFIHLTLNPMRVYNYGFLRSFLMLRALHLSLFSVLLMPSKATCFPPDPSFKSEAPILPHLSPPYPQRRGGQSSPCNIFLLNLDRFHPRCT